MTEIWFYKGSGKVIDKLVKWWTSEPYSHCEIVINGYAVGADAWSGRVIGRSTSTFNMDRWDIIGVPDGDNEWLISQIGKRYDYLGILGFFLFKVDHPNWWYCSELAASYLKILARPISPGKLYTILRGKYKHTT